MACAFIAAVAVAALAADAASAPAPVAQADSAIAGSAALAATAGQDARKVADMSRYRFGEARPRISLTRELLVRLRKKVDAGDHDWQAVKAEADRAVASPGGGDVLSTALVYRLTGERQYAEATVRGLKRLCSEMQTIFAGKSYDLKWNTGKWIGNSFAVAYDWVRDAMTDADVKELTGSPGLATAGEWLTAQYAKMRPFEETDPAVAADAAMAESARPHVDTNTWIHWATNSGLVWLALHGDSPQVDEWGRRSMLAASVWTAYHRKVLKGGISFAAIGYGTGVNQNIFKFCEGVQTATGVDLWRDLGDWPEEVVYRWLYWTGPDFRTINHYGHHKRSFAYHQLNDNQEMMMFWLAHHLRGTDAGRLAQGWLKNCSPFRRANGATFERFLMHDPDAPTASPDGLPLTYLSEYRGEVVARSDWTRDATWVSFRCGKTHTGEFFRPDAGHFNIMKGPDRFAADTGGDDYSWSAHTSGFRNTIVIGGKTQLPWGTWVNQTGYGKMWQKTPEVLRKKEEILRDYEESFGKILALEDRGAYVYAAGDFAGAYNVPGHLEVARACTRQIVFLRPGTLVIFDRVEAAEPTRVEWRCHVPGGGDTDVKLADRAFVVKTRNHQMVCTTLLPQKTHVSMVPTNTLNDNKGFAGWQMIQVTTEGPEKEVSFLLVCTIGPAGKAEGVDAAAEVLDGRAELRLSLVPSAAEGADGKTFTLSFSTKGKVGGAIRVGAAPAVDLAQDIRPQNVLVNSPAVGRTAR